MPYLFNKNKLLFTKNNRELKFDSQTVSCRIPARVREKLRKAQCDAFLASVMLNSVQCPPSVRSPLKTSGPIRLRRGRPLPRDWPRRRQATGSQCVLVCMFISEIKFLFKPQSRGLKKERGGFVIEWRFQFEK